MPKKEAISEGRMCCECSGKMMSLGLILLGILIYIKNLGMIPAIYFWPAIFILAGLGMFLKKGMKCSC